MSGVSGWDQPVETSNILDLETSTARLAQQAPWWEPGTASGYHATTQGHQLGELVRRKTGKSLKQFIAENLAGPLAADFQLGAKEEDWPRIAPVISPPPLPFDLRALGEDSLPVKTLLGPYMDSQNREYSRLAPGGARCPQRPHHCAQH
ncbi:hypothetical protein R6Q59_009893 [Mikania micrantha]